MMSKAKLYENIAKMIFKPGDQLQERVKVLTEDTFIEGEFYPKDTKLLIITEQREADQEIHEEH